MRVMYALLVVSLVSAGLVAADCDSPALLTRTPLWSVISARSSSDGYPPEHAFDDDEDTSWRGTSNTNQWVSIDLGEVHKISEFKVHTVANRAKAIIVSTATATGSEKEQLKEGEVPFGGDKRASGPAHIILETQAEGRYFRFTVVNTGIDGDSGSYASIAFIQIIGLPASCSSQSEVVPKLATAPRNWEIKIVKEGVKDLMANNDGYQLAEDGTSVLICNEADSNVLRYTPSTDTIEVYIEDPAIEAPEEIAIQTGGYIFISDDSGGAVHRVGPDKKLEKFVNKDGNRGIELKSPEGVAVFESEDGSVKELYIADEKLKKLFRLNLIGDDAQLEEIPDPLGLVQTAEGMGVSKEGYVYIADDKLGGVIKFDRNTGKLSEFLTTSQAPEPEGLSVDQNGDIWLTENAGDDAKPRISHFSPDGVLLEEFTVPDVPRIKAPLTGVVALRDGSGRIMFGANFWTEGKRTDYLFMATPDRAEYYLQDGESTTKTVEEAEKEEEEVESSGTNGWDIKNLINNGLAEGADAVAAHPDGRHVVVARGDSVVMMNPLYLETLNEAPSQSEWNQRCTASFMTVDRAGCVFTSEEDADLVAVDNAGVIYYAKRQGGKLMKYEWPQDEEGSSSSVRLFNRLKDDFEGVAVGADNLLYTAGTKGGRFVISKGEELAKLADQGDGLSTDALAGMATSIDGTLFVAYQTGGIVSVTREKIVFEFLGPNSVPKPGGIAIDFMGNVYISDNKDNKPRLLVFDRTGALQEVISLMPFLTGNTVDEGGAKGVTVLFTGEVVVTVTYSDGGKQYSDVLLLRRTNIDRKEIDSRNDLAWTAELAFTYKQHNLQEPEGLTTMPRSGYILVANEAGNNLMVLDPVKRDVVETLQIPELKGPKRVATDALNHFYIADRDANAVYKYAKGRPILKVVDSNSAEKPYGIAVDDELDNVYFSDIARRRVMVCIGCAKLINFSGPTLEEILNGDSPGDYQLRVVADQDDDMYQPTDLQFNNGFLYICNDKKGGVYRVDVNGTMTTFISPEVLSRPASLTFDSQGHVYVVANNDDKPRLWHFDGDGQFVEWIQITAIPSVAKGALNGVTAIMIDGVDHIFISASYWTQEPGDTKPRRRDQIYDLYKTDSSNATGAIVGGTIAGASVFVGAIAAGVVRHKRQKLKKTDDDDDSVEMSNV